MAWESQSTNKVARSAVARHAARFTAVVVLPTPPFWLAIAMMRAKLFSQTCKTYQTPTAVARCFTWNNCGTEDFCQSSKCSTWNTGFSGILEREVWPNALFPASPSSPAVARVHPEMFHVEHPLERGSLESPDEKNQSEAANVYRLPWLSLTRTISPAGL